MPRLISLIVAVLLLALVAAEYTPDVSQVKEEVIADAYAYFDDSSAIVGLRDKRLIISQDNGRSWSQVDAAKGEHVLHFQLDPIWRRRAFAFTTGKTQFVTTDCGKSWQKFTLDVKENDIALVPRVLFNSRDQNLAMIEYYLCPEHESFSDRCKHLHYYTKDGFKTSPHRLELEAKVCHFAASTPSSASSKAASTIFCSVNKVNSFGHVVESLLVESDDFFKTRREVLHDLSKTGSIIDIKFVLEFMAVIIQNDKFNAKSKVSVMISKNFHTFKLSNLAIDISYGALKFLPSTPLSLFLAVIDYSNAHEDVSFSTIYTSDSLGLRFTKRLMYVKSDAILQVQGIAGSWIVQIGDDDDEKTHKPSLIDLLLGGGYEKNLKSVITVDDGRTWNTLKVTETGDETKCLAEDGCSLHLVNPTERDGEGKFVTGPTPGILLGVGNVGKHISHAPSDLHTWVSRDGGVNWRYALKEPCIFSMGDLGNAIVAVPYYEREDSISKYYYFSVDQGKSWKKVDLDTAIYPLTLTTTTDGTLTQFLLTGLVDKTPDDPTDLEFREIIYSIDLSKAFGNKKCDTNKDFDTVYARIGQSDEPTCVYGAKEKYSRRKQDSKCYVDELYDDLKIDIEPCECSGEDFECSELFEWDPEAEKCIVDKNAVTYKCSLEKNPRTASFSVMDRRQISGDLCRGSSESFSNKVKFECKDFVKGSGDNKDDGVVNNGEIFAKLNVFDGQILQYSYFEQGEGFSGENVVVKLSNNNVYASNNGGSEFVKVKILESVLGYYTGYVTGHIIILTDSKTFYVSIDGINYLKKYEAPSMPNKFSQVISFHKTDTNQFIWYSSENCVSKYSTDCDIVAYQTKDGGNTFTKLKEHVRVCDYVGPFFTSENADNKTIFCSTQDKHNGQLSLVSTTNDFKDEQKHFDDIVGYAITGDYVVVATIDKEIQSLRAKVTIDGKTFANADFPKNFKVNANVAYTVLDSSTKAIFMHVTTNNMENREFGSILKSNSNGTSYVSALDNVNRNRVGYVDFDRIEGLEGTIISNIVVNAQDVSGGKSDKSLKTQISHNDGGEWSYLAPPSVDSKGKKYSCIGSPLEKCSLNLHGFTERADYRDTYSSASATGFIIGVGNVGEYLEPYLKSATFMSSDGGITWKEIKDGVHMWEYGDRGTVLILVGSKEATDRVSYSLDDGATWLEYRFADEPIQVLDLATVPSDTSRKFLVFGHKHSDRRQTLAYSIDFTNVHKRQCQLDLDNPDSDDFEYWTPSHPFLAENCLFGHESRYLRRAVGHDDCFIGSAPLKEGFKVVKNCACTRKDFECDYNYVRDTGGTCKLVPGLSPTDRQDEYCKKPDAFEYFEPTGYRKIPLSTCEGGKKYDAWNVHACPGKEKEFNKHHGKDISGNRVLLLIGIPLFVFLFSVWFVYDKGIRRNGGFKRLGQIRLDLEDDDGFQPIEENNVDRVVNRIVSGGILVVAGAIATFKTVRKIDRMMFDKLAAQIFRRGRGSRSQRNYVQVPTDILLAEEEEELFRDDYEDNLNDDGIHIDQANPFRDEDGDNDITNFADEDRDALDVDSRLFNIDDQSEEELTR